MYDFYIREEYTVHGWQQQKYYRTLQDAMGVSVGWEQVGDIWYLHSAFLRIVGCMFE